MKSSIKTTVDRQFAEIFSSSGDWVDAYWMNLAALPYFAVVWAFGTYVGEIATPWTIGYIFFWLIYSPIATFTGIYVLGGAFRLCLLCFAVLAAAAFYVEGARTILVTILASGIVGVNLWVWIPGAVFCAAVSGIWIWYHGGIAL